MTWDCGEIPGTDRRTGFVCSNRGLRGSVRIRYVSTWSAHVTAILILSLLLLFSLFAPVRRGTRGSRLTLGRSGISRHSQLVRQTLTDHIKYNQYYKRIFISRDVSCARRS